MKLMNSRVPSPAIKSEGPSPSGGADALISELNRTRPLMEKLSREFQSDNPENLLRSEIPGCYRVVLQGR